MASIVPWAVVWATVALLACVVSATDRGVVYVDDLTFNRVVDGSHNILVHFDKEYAWGDDHDAFKEIAKQVGEGDADLLVVGVAVGKREFEPINTDLASAWGVVEAAYPVYKMFKRGVSARTGGKSVLNYTGSSKKASDVLAWVGQQSGMFFGLKGQLRELNDLASRLAAAPADKRKALLPEAERLASKAAPKDKGHAAYYVKVLKKVLDKPDYAHFEISRLGNILKGKLSDDMKEAFQVKLNILAAFTPGFTLGDRRDEM